MKDWGYFYDREKVRKGEPMLTLRLAIAEEVCPNCNRVNKDHTDEEFDVCMSSIMSGK